jgi:tRNA-dihydrouridine synthase A
MSSTPTNTGTGRIVDPPQTDAQASAWKLSTAPMMGWSDRHCRYLHRLLTRRTRLYTEMVTSAALIHGDAAQLLQFNAEEHTLALQLGGSNPADLARCARMGQERGYDEINLNCGCPSERVQSGSFGACLMSDAPLVADCLKAMLDAVQIPVTVKHRIGIDAIESYDFVADFVGTLAQAGCQVFIVHARNAWLKGLSPRENRQLPPLRYDVVQRLKREFPQLVIVINGGIKTTAEMARHLLHVDGVMLGREAYHNPWIMSDWDTLFFGDAPRALTREAVEKTMVDYMERAHAQDGAPWYAIARHMLGLRGGLRGARLWRQVWSDHRLKPLPASDVAALAGAHWHL